MADTTNRSDSPLPPCPWPRPAAPETGPTERLVRETWRHYYVARLAEAQFGPDSLEASVAHSRALTSYRELRKTLHEVDPYYRAAERRTPSQQPAIRHLKLVRDDGLDTSASSES